MIRRALLIYLFFGVFTSQACAQTHPMLSLTAEGVEEIRNGGSSVMFDEVMAHAIRIVDEAITEGVQVPIPKDMAGGYTHEQHKKNYRNMHLAGALFQIIGDTKYALFIKENLMAYAKMYKALPIHPTDRSYSTGKIFWQCLNDANWLVYTSMAYDCIYDYLSEKERKYLDSELFRPFADFISVENPQFFNRVHNHSTWGNAAVGMIGLVINDEDLIQRALYGIPLSEDDAKAKDDDGGFIFEKGKAGFYAQMDNAFSPDGYYTEGPYYQRYAMTPFMFFALALHNTRPELKIFDYRKGLLTKAVYALIYQSDSEGRFFPINDAQKGMSLKAESVVAAVNIAYGITRDSRLLSIAQQQGDLLLDQSGYAISKGIEKGNSQPFIKQSIELTDGANGDEGALGILRTSDEEKEITVVFKYTSQGLGHGHYDKLSYLLYDNSTEVLQDYGAARWVNIDQKAGGRYLKENTSWAKQTIAHNTLVVDQKSHFNGIYDVANSHHSEPYLFHTENENLQVASATESNAYEGVKMRRTLFLLKDESFSHPVLIDLMNVQSDEEHSYDLPIQYADHLLETNIDYTISESRKVMGDNSGYQHIFLEATGSSPDNQMYFNWMKDDKFYSITSTVDTGDKFLFARIGANDPDFNLRRDAILIHRKENSKNAIFLSAIESHGKYSRVTELVNTPYKEINSLDVVYKDDNYTIFTISSKQGKSWTIMFSQKNNEITKNHIVYINNQAYSWKGPVHMITNN
jgi:hypothetical protein